MVSGTRRTAPGTLQPGSGGLGELLKLRWQGDDKQFLDSEVLLRLFISSSFSEMGASGLSGGGNSPNSPLSSPESPSIAAKRSSFPILCRKL